MAPLGGASPRSVPAKATPPLRAPRSTPRKRRKCPKRCGSDEGSSRPTSPRGAGSRHGPGLERREDRTRRSRGAIGPPPCRPCAAIWTRDCRRPRLRSAASTRTRLFAWPPPSAWRATTRPSRSCAPVSLAAWGKGRKPKRFRASSRNRGPRRPPREARSDRPRADAPRGDASRCRRAAALRAAAARPRATGRPRSGRNPGRAAPCRRRPARRARRSARPGR